jgi:hypothetical protein
MLRAVLVRSLAYAGVGWLASFIVKSIRVGPSLGTARDALGFALIWAIGGALLGVYHAPHKDK